MFFTFALWVTSVSAPSLPQATTTPTKQIQIQTTPTEVKPTLTPTILSPTPETITFYTVQPGDTLGDIADKYGLTWVQLAEYNKLKDPNSLQVGQIIKVSHNKEDYVGLDKYYQTKILEVGENEKYILVVLSEQKLYAYEGKKLIYEYLISSGTSDHQTVTGVFKIWIKLEETTMSGGTGADAYYLTGVKYTMYFYGDYGIHGTYWHNNFGTPMSHGCINLSEPNAEELFYWAEVGTIVHVIP